MLERRTLLLERLESRSLLATVSAINFADESYFGDTSGADSALASPTKLGPSVTADGQRILFESSAPDLVPNDFNNAPDVFVYDRETGAVTLVTANGQGTRASQRGGFDAVMTPDGRYVVFRSDSDDLTSTPINNFFFGQHRIFWKDLTTGEVRQVNVAPDGSDTGAADSASISDDGRYVLFRSLEGNAITPAAGTTSNSQYFLRDMTTGTTELVSRTAAGQFSNRGMGEGRISGNGSTVLFETDADDLDPRDANTAGDLFAYDIATRQVQLVTVSADGSAAAGGQPVIGPRPISADGRYVVYHAFETTAVAQNTALQRNAFLFDRVTQTTTLLSASADGDSGTDGTNVSITANGQWVTFLSGAPELPTGVDDTNNSIDVILSDVRNLSAITHRLVSVSAAGTNGGNDHSGQGQYPFDFAGGFPQATPDGRYVVFEGSATDLAPGVTDANDGFTAAFGNFRRDVFLRDMTVGQTRYVSITPRGTTSGDDGSYTPVISADGSIVAFESLADDLAPGQTDGNRRKDVLVRDLKINTTELASHRSPFFPTEIVPPDGYQSLQAVTPDGRYVLFTATSPELAPDLEQSELPNLYLADRTTGNIELVSRLPDGRAAGSVGSASAISPDGRFVAFWSEAWLDVDVDPLSRFQLYRRDLVTGRTVMVSVSTNPAQGSEITSFGGEPSVAMSEDGRFIAWQTDADDLVPGFSDGNGAGVDVFVRDLTQGVTRLASHVSSSSTASGDGSSIAPQISADGSRVAFLTAATNLQAGVIDLNGEDDLATYAREDGTVRYASVTPLGTSTGTFGVGAFDLAAGGRFVAFQSRASDLTSIDTDDADTVYRRDLDTGVTDLVASDTAGGAANSSALSPSISADGRVVIFESQATDLVTLPIPEFSTQIYARDYGGATPVTSLVTVRPDGTAGAAGHSSFGLTSGPTTRITDDGRYVVFLSDSDELTPGFVDANGSSAADLFLRDLATGRTILASPANSGTTGADAGIAAGQFGRAGTYVVAADRPIVMFDSPAANLVNGDRNGESDLFAFDYVGGGTIAGSVLADPDGDGTSSGAGPGLAYWTVYLDANGNGLFDSGETSVQTDAYGEYRFTNLAAGNYSVRAVLPNGFRQTAPLGDLRSRSVALPTDVSSSSNNTFFVQLAPADLDVTLVTAPATAEPGRPVTVTWQVRNAGDASVTAATQDAVFLSLDDTLDPSDPLVATFSRTRSLAAGGLYTGSATFLVPAVSPGAYRVFVVADRRYQVPNENNRANNVSAATTTTVVSIPTLAVGASVSGTFAPGDDQRYFRVTVAAGQTVVLTLDSAAANGATELFLARNRLPSFGDFDDVSVVATPDQTLVLRDAQPGEYYVLAHGRSGGAASAPFTLSAAAAMFGLAGIDTSTGGAGGRVTLEARGNLFTPSTVFTLVRGGVSIAAAAVDFRDSGLAYVTFDLSGVTPGTYDLRAVDGTNQSVLAAAVQVTPQPLAVVNPYDVRLITPGALRQGRTSSVLVRYTNTSNVDQPAPLLELRTNTRMRLAEQEDFRGAFNVESGIDFLGIAPDGPAGVLRPGQTGEQRIFFQTEPGEGGFDVRFTVQMLDPTAASAVDWNSFNSSMRPSTMPTDAWNAIFENFLAEVGSTTGDYVRLLGANASYLSRLGVRTTDVSRLLAFELQQANGGYGQSAPAAVVDASVEGPGGGIVFGRAFGATIADRYRLGVFGRGWSHNWEMSLAQDASGNVTVSQRGVTETFTRLADGTYVGDAGDANTLTALPGGGFRATSPAGEATQFRADGRLDFAEDRNGNRTTAGYDESGRLASLTHTGGAGLTFAYDVNGRLASLIESTGREVHYNYDDSGEHLLGSTSAVVSYTYRYVLGAGAARQHALAEVVLPDATSLQLTYDVQGRPITRRLVGNGLQQQVSVTYDSAAGVTVTSDGGGAITVLYADGGQPALIRDALGRTVKYGFDPQGRIDEVTTASGLTYGMKFNPVGQLIESTDPLGRTVQYAYAGPYRQLATVTDARGFSTSYGYDAQGNLTRIADAAGSVDRYEFDARGNLMRAVDGRGRAGNYQYDAQGRMIAATFEDGSSATYVYDARGKLRTVTDASGVTTLTYEPSTERLMRVDQPDGRFLAFTFDDAGRRASRTDQTGFRTNYVYDGLGRLAEVRDASNTPLAVYHYDALGRLIRRDNGNGTFTTYLYDAAGQLLTLTHFASGGAVNARLVYTYDAEGRRASETLTDADPATTDGTTLYGYDPLGQLVSIVLPGGRSIAYEYDAAGNRTRVVDSSSGVVDYEVDPANRILRAGSKTFTYDGDGNLTSTTDGQAVVHYSYNDRGQLVTADGTEGLFQYEYDPFGNRRAETRDGVRTEYHNDPTLVTGEVAEYGAGGAVVARYVSDGGLLARIGSTGSAAYYDYDSVANTVGLTDDTGRYVNRYAYLPYGETTTVAGALPNLFTFGGQLGARQSGDGLALMGFRNFSSLTGQFTSNDPLGLFAGDPNIRRYVGNSPTNAIDPLGLCSITVGPSGGADGFVGGVTRTFNSDGSVMATLSIGFGTPGVTAVSVSNGDASPGLSATASGALALPSYPGLSAGGSLDLTGLLGRYLDNAMDTLYNQGRDQVSWQNALKDCTTANLNAGYDPGGGSITANFTYQEAGPDPQRAFDCNPFGGGGPPGIGPRSFLGGGIPNILRAIDPNDITGPAGVGAERYVRAADPMPYTIRFENVSTATAPAQEVFVTHQLDADLDFTTFRLGDFGWGGITVDVPDGLQSYSTSVDTTNLDGSPLSVDVTVEFVPVEGRVQWTFRSRDPQTGLLPEDALAGFLPPNDASGRGNGFVNYTVFASTDQPNGTSVDQQASIVFDTNNPILTNIYSNRLDAAPPTSAVQPLPAATSLLTFNVSWSGSDPSGSGVASFDVLVSDNGQPFVLWKSRTAQTSGSYVGQVDHEYRFFSVAYDRVGYAESMPATFDTKVLVADSAWHNPRNPLDVDDDGFVAPIDALLVINELNEPAISDRSGRLPSERFPANRFYLDVTGDGLVAPLDALRVINFINGLAEGEGESTNLPGWRSVEAVSQDSSLDRESPAKLSLAVAPSGSRPTVAPRAEAGVTVRAVDHVRPDKTSKRLPGKRESSRVIRDDWDELLQELAVEVAARAVAGRNTATDNVR